MHPDAGLDSEQGGGPNEAVDIRTNFSDVDQRLTVFDNFYRTARGVLVNFDYVSGITNAQFVMKGGKRIPITKTAVTTTCRAYAEYTFTRMRTED